MRLKFKDESTTVSLKSRAFELEQGRQERTQEMLESIFKRCIEKGYQKSDVKGDMIMFSKPAPDYVVDELVMRQWDCLIIHEYNGTVTFPDYNDPVRRESDTFDIPESVKTMRLEIEARQRDKKNEIERKRIAVANLEMESVIKEYVSSGFKRIYHENRIDIYAKQHADFSRSFFYAVFPIGERGKILESRLNTELINRATVSTNEEIIEYVEKSESIGIAIEDSADVSRDVFIGLDAISKGYMRANTDEILLRDDIISNSKTSGIRIEKGLNDHYTITGLQVEISKGLDWQSKRWIKFIASTANIDRQADIILRDAWRPLPAAGVPLCMYHDKVAIGRVMKAEKSAMGLDCQAFFSEASPAGLQAYEMCKEGTIADVSVSFYAHSGAKNNQGGTTFSDVTLLEISLVAVPANAEARIYEVH